MALNLEDNLINLEVEGTIITCNKSELINNSDYFKVMFEGDFVESAQKTIKLNDVPLEDFNQILKFLWDKSLDISEKQLYSVLQTASMLQFLDFVNFYTDKLDEKLCTENCLDIWFKGEQLNLKPLYLKAKLIALNNFDKITKTMGFLNINLNQICDYLGSIYLQVKNEITVIENALNWYMYQTDKKFEDLEKLLSCVDWSQISDVREVKNVNDNAIRAEILNKAFSKSKSTPYRHRKQCWFPCIVVQQDTPQNKTSVYQDKYKRKREYNILDSECNNLSIYYLDDRKGKTISYHKLSTLKHTKLDGFTVIGWKHYLYMLGGEKLIGKGGWNTKIMVCDLTKKESWTLKPMIEVKRRHFQIVICDSYLFIVGGTGPFRIVHDDILFIDLKSSITKNIPLPCTGRQIKACNLDNKLFILDLNSKRGFIFNQSDNSHWFWDTWNIIDSKGDLPSFADKLTVFYYNPHLYIKGDKLMQLEVKRKELEVIETIPLASLPDFNKIDSILCNNWLYSLFKNDESSETFIEFFNIDTFESSIEKFTTDKLGLSSNCFKFSLLSAQHYYFLENEEKIFNQ